MGLYDFALDFGKKLFGNETDAAQKIKEHIEADNPGVKDLQVDFAQNEVKLSGQAASAEALEKAVLMAGNVQGVKTVSAAGMTAPPQTGKVEYYEIQKGDTLSAIAKKFLGQASAYPKIFEANREVIKDPNLIYPGQKIRIPIS